MRIRPHYSRLRAVALGCWAIATFYLIQGGLFSLDSSAVLVLTISTRLLGILLLALGIAFWLLSNDRQAGIVLDSKGLLLNLGDSTSFIAWHNIERFGISSHRSRLLTIGSRNQFGIRLHDASAYIQSYEERMPATAGVFGGALRGLAWVLRPLRRSNDCSITTQLAQNRANTGFDILIPEALVGGHAEMFLTMVESYRRVGVGVL